MPAVPRCVSRQFVAGAVLGVAFAVALVALDVGRLGTVIAGADAPLLPLAILGVNLAGLFATAVAACGIES